MLRLLTALICAALGALASASVAPRLVARLLPARLELTIHSDSARTVTPIAFVGEDTRLTRGEPWSIPAGAHRALSFPLPEGASGLGLDLGPVAGRVELRGLRVARLTRLAEWADPQGLERWRSLRGVERRAVRADALDLSVGPDALLGHPEVGSEIRLPLRAEGRGIAFVAGLLGALPGLAWLARAWRRAPGSARRTAARLALAGASLAVASGLALWWWSLARETDPPTGFEDPTGDYTTTPYSNRGIPLARREGELALLLDPFCGYRPYPLQAGASFTIDEHGFRGGLGDQDKPLAFLVGGSTAFGWGLPSDEVTLSARLRERVPSCTFVNAAAGGWGSAQELAAMVHHLDAWHPQLYVVLDGYNDFVGGVVSTKDFPALQGRPIQGVNDKFFDTMARRLHQGALSEAGDAPLPRRRASLWKELSPEQRFDRTLEVYVSNLERMDAWARARGARFLVAFQPTVSSRSVASDEELGIQQRLPGILDQYPRFLEAAARRCAELGIAHVDLNGDPSIREAPGTLFLDVCHLTPEGTRVLAEALARAIEGLGG